MHSSRTTLLLRYFAAAVAFTHAHTRAHATYLLAAYYLGSGSPFALIDQARPLTRWRCAATRKTWR